MDIRVLKSEIITQHLPREGYYFDTVLNINESTTIIISVCWKKETFIDLLINGKQVDSFSLKGIRDFEFASIFNGYNYFQTPNEFGIIWLTKVILSWKKESIRLTDFSFSKILNPFPPDSNHRQIKSKLYAYDYKTKSILMGLEDYSHSGWPPKCIIHLNKKRNLLFSTPNWEWEKSVFTLPLEKLASTQFFYLKREWLNIRAFFTKDECLFVHTTGGASTRTKSGNAFEFSIIAQFDHLKRWVRNYEIAKGIGRITFNRDYFIVHPLTKKNRLYVYNTQDFTLDFELSLTVKQNMGIHKISGHHVSAELIGDQLLVYKPSFLNFCRLTDS
tara:strand:- start:309 stop:1301 length:993 start_codon:yes stop_codon:yes gene_type:complete